MFMKLIILISIGIFVVLGVSYGLLQKTAPAAVSVKSYEKNTQDRPKAFTEKKTADMGTVKVSGEATADFVIKNTGKKPLQLFDISTSCGCTLAQILYQDKKSPLFGMHTKGDFDTEIAPRTEAQVKVIYQPYVMPVYGKVEREVYISTNDPENSKLVFQVTAFVK